MRKVQLIVYTCCNSHSKLLAYFTTRLNWLGIASDLCKQQIINVSQRNQQLQWFFINVLRNEDDYGGMLINLLDIQCTREKDMPYVVRKPLSKSSMHRIQTNSDFSANQKKIKCISFNLNKNCLAKFVLKTSFACFIVKMLRILG